MAYDRFMIAPLDAGLQSDVKPWAIQDQAFASLNNAYAFRGRIRKRFGANPINTNVLPNLWQQYTRLRIAVPNTNAKGITSGAGAITAGGHVPDGLIAPATVYTGALGQMFSIGDDYFTVVDDTPGNQPLRSSNPAASGTFDVTNGAYSFANATPATQLYYYPALPAMGFVTYNEGNISNDTVFAFDTKFAYIYAGGWARSGTLQWSGSDSQFFGGTTWHGAVDYSNILFVTNYNTTDKIAYFDGVTWNTFTPTVNSAGPTLLHTARVMLVFKGRLLAFNTIEGIAGGPYYTYFNRVRWTYVGNPLDAANAWNESIPGNGSFLDCSCKEAIITAQIIKDRVIVYFESSTWELVYTGNEVFPFRWNQFNSELGVESTFSEVPFDQSLLGIGNVGIHACNGIQVERIDHKIPDDVFKINSLNDGTKRVAGIRDFQTEMVYWTFPADYSFGILPLKYPNRVLVYNYRNNSWAYNDDSITAFGYFQQQTGLTWDSELVWDDVDEPWDSGLSSDHEKTIVAGNQQGFTFLIQRDTPRNAMSLQVTDIDIVNSILTVIDHNLQADAYVLLENATGIDFALNDKIYMATPITANTIQLHNFAATTAYTGGGTLALVSEVNMQTKQYNFYVQQGRNAAVSKVDFLVDNSVTGELTVECFPSYSTSPLVEDGIANGSILGTSVLSLAPYPDITLEAYQTQFWHTVYLQAEGESVQLQLSMSDQQMRDPDSALAPFQLHAFTIYATPTSSRMQ